jgi:hypothetical protein
MSTTLVSLNPQIVADLQTMEAYWKAVAAELSDGVSAPATPKRAPSRKRRSKPKA